MENTTVSGLRSRSRSKTPFLRSSRDSVEGNEPANTKSGRKTPVKRSTPIKQLQKPSTTGKATPEPPIIEIDDEHITPPAHRTRQATRSVPEKAANETLVKTSDYSSEESPDRMRKEMAQNQLNYKYEHERVSTSQRSYNPGSLADATLSPIHASYNVSADRSARFGSPAYSGCSTDSSFAEQALADVSQLLDRDQRGEHLPYRLYKMAGEYWNKYPKTDYTYSPLSKDRVELAPGQIAVPNMSRRSLSMFRIQGPNTSADEVDQLMKKSSFATSTLRKRYTSIDSSDDESSYVRGNGGYTPIRERWWITQLLITIVTTITETTSNAYRRVVGPSHRYPYTERSPSAPGIASRTASAVAAPFYWIYTVIKKVVTTTVTTITETVTPSANHVAYQTTSARAYQAQRAETKRRWWPLFLLLLLPLLGYGSYYTYENLEHLAMPNFTDFRLDLPEFDASKLALALPSLPNISFPELNILPHITLPDINITLPEINIRENLPEVSKTYFVYKDIVQNRVADATDYMTVVAESCFEELRRYWRGVLG